MLKQATLDLLDSELSTDHAELLAQEPKFHWKTYQQAIVISPKYWTDYYPASSLKKLKWKEVRYSKLGKHLAKIKSKKVGIYYFFVRPEKLIGQRPQFVFYVGISGEHGSMRPLVSRLEDYLHIDKVKKRKAVHTQLQLYYPVVWVAYSFLTLHHKKIAELEENLHGFFYPWAGSRDFPIDVKAGRGAWP